MNVFHLIKKRTVVEWIKYIYIKVLKEPFEKIIYSSDAFISGKYLARRPLFTKKELIKQKNHIFNNAFKFSVIVIISNTNENYLTEVIESIKNQTYYDWELCLGDESDLEHNYVPKICLEYISKDDRIRYIKLEKDAGISANTNACIKTSSGEYIVIVAPSDVLHPATLFEMMKTISTNSADFLYTDEAKFFTDIRKAYDFKFKPCYAPDTLLSNNYINHASAFSRELFESVGGFKSEYDDRPEYDFILRATDMAKKVMHIPEVLYYVRTTDEFSDYNANGKSVLTTTGVKTVRNFLYSKGIAANITSSEKFNSVYRIKYELTTHPKVSILIPNYEHIAELKRCINSILNKSTYDNYEIIIIENNSQSDDIFAYYSNLEGTHNNIKILRYCGAFNYSKINNYGAKNSNGEILLLLNNDIEIITPDWIQEMLMYALRVDVGAVGAKLYYPDDTIQHGGVVLGAGGIAGHSFYHVNGNSDGYMQRLLFVQNVTAVTGACLMIRRETWNSVLGLSEELAVAFNDVDLCLKIRKQKKLIVWTPFAELYHYESISRGNDSSKSNRDRFNVEIRTFKKKWGDELAEGDPYYNPNFIIDNAKCYMKRSMKQYKAR